MSASYGWSLYYGGNISGAEREAHHALGTAPENQDALFLLAHCKLAQKDQKEAREIVQNILALDVSAYHAWLLLGHIDFSEGLFHAAKPSFLSALELAPEEASVHHALASLYAVFEKKSQAQIHYDEALNLDPDDPDILTDYAKFCIKYGKNADEIIMRAAEIAPSSVEVNLLLAELALVNGALDEARERVIWVLMEDSENVGARKFLLKIKAANNFIFTGLVKLHTILENMPDTRKIMGVGLCLGAFFLMRSILLSFAPSMFHHIFVMVCVLISVSILLLNTFIELLIEREMKEVSLRNDY